jgi:hypothetical protein
MEQAKRDIPRLFGSMIAEDHWSIEAIHAGRLAILFYAPG